MPSLACGTNTSVTRKSPAYGPRASRPAGVLRLGGPLSLGLRMWGRSLFFPRESPRSSLESRMTLRGRDEGRGRYTYAVTGETLRHFRCKIEPAGTAKRTRVATLLSGGVEVLSHSAFPGDRGAGVWASEGWTNRVGAQGRLVVTVVVARGSRRGPGVRGRRTKPAERGSRQRDRGQSGGGRGGGGGGGAAGGAAGRRGRARKAPPSPSVRRASRRTVSLAPPTDRGRELAPRPRGETEAQRLASGPRPRHGGFNALASHRERRRRGASGSGSRAESLGAPTHAEAAGSAGVGGRCYGSRRRASGLTQAVGSPGARRPRPGPAGSRLGCPPGTPP